MKSQSVNMLKLFTPFCFCFLIASHVFGQDLNYGTLELPDVERHRFTTSLSGSLDTEDQTKHHRLNIPIRFDGYVNKRYRQLFYDSEFRSYYGSNQSELSSNRALMSSIDFDLDHRRYNQNYFFINPELSGRVDGFREETEGPMRVYSKRQGSLNYAASLAIGKGRVDPIDWGIRAGFMNRNLVRSGGISQSLTNSQLLELATTMAKMDRRRFYEGRFFNINRMKALDSLLSGFGVKEDDISFYTTLSDLYFFVPYKNIRRGKMIRFKTAYRASTGSALVYDEFRGSITELDGSESTSAVWIGIERASYIPKNLHWHHEFSWSVGYQHTLNEFNPTPANYATEVHIFPYQLDAEIGYGLQWLPNTRTYLDFNTSLKQASPSTNPADFLSEESILRLNNALRLNYFVNRSLGYTVALVSNTLYQNGQVLDQSIFSVNLGLNYQIW